MYELSEHDFIRLTSFIKKLNSSLLFLLFKKTIPAGFLIGGTVDSVPLSRYFTCLKCRSFKWQIDKTHRESYDYTYNLQFILWDGRFKCDDRDSTGGA